LFENIFSNFEFLLNKNLLKINILFVYSAFDYILFVYLMNIVKKMIFKFTINDIRKIFFQQNFYTLFLDEQFEIVVIDHSLIEVFWLFH
jgi:hypothetical protein